MTTQATGEIRPESNQPATQAQARRQAFAEAIQRKRESLDMCLEMVLHEVRIDHLRGSSLVCLQSVCEEIAMACQTLREKAKEEAVKPVESNPATVYLASADGEADSRAKAVPLGGFVKRQAEELGLSPMPLETNLLLARIRQGGDSGRFLADAFLSAYRKGVPFKHSLGELVNLDAEGFRLFHECLHIRHVPGWSDDGLYRIEQQVKAVMEGIA